MFPLCISVFALLWKCSGPPKPMSSNTAQGTSQNAASEVPVKKPAPVDQSPKATVDPEPEETTGFLIKLTWDANSEEDLTEYRIYGLEKDSVIPPMKLITVDLADIDQAAPAVEIDSDDYPIIATLKGKTGCFFITAMAGGKESPPSDTQCKTL